MLYGELLLKLGNERLELHRLRADLQMCYRILHHLFINLQTTFSLLPNYRVDARANFFSVRIINVWNRLSNEIVNTSSISSFHDKLVETESSFIVYIYIAIQKITTVLLIIIAVKFSPLK